MSGCELNESDKKTPRSVRARISATSTANKAKGIKRPETEIEESQLENSLGLLSLNNVDLSNIFSVPSGRGSIDELINQQRQLASNTLQRASKVMAIPSQLLKPDFLQTKSEIDVNFPSDSTISESDLLIKNTSTPRNSAIDVELKNLSNPRESIYLHNISVFKDMLDTNISTQNAIEEFKLISQAYKTDTDNQLDSGLFIPAENAVSKLLADEISWQKKNDMPVTQGDISSFQDIKDVPSMSIGEFFQERSDNASDLRATSPKKSEPLALVESSDIFRDTSDVKDESACQSRSLSITAIQQLLAEADDTPRKVMDYLFNQKRKTTEKTESSNTKSNSSSDVFSLPVSRDSSYTSSFSDNEAVKAVVNEDKENIQPINKNKIKVEVITHQPLPQNVSSPNDPKTLSPSRSSSSLTSLPNGKLPIESTVSELVWGCVKVDRCVTKEFMLRNKTPKTLRLQCSLSTYEFKIRKDNRSDSDPLSACKFVLHGHESRPLIISYIPTKIGAAVDELVFAPLDANLTQTKKQCVRLWGYGGYINVEYLNAIRDNTGKYWLSLGRMDNRVLMEQSFTIKNTGNLPSFTLIKVVPKHIVTFSNLKVEPNLFVLLPNEEKDVKVIYIPTAKDCKILKQSLTVLPVTDIGKLEVISGPEVNRARLRRLYRKSIEKGLIVDPQLQILKERIVGENFPSDITRFKESPNAVPEIMETLSNDEVVITIEQDPNETLVADYPDDSIIYQSLCQDSTIVNDESIMSQASCRLEPPCLVLLPPSKIEDSLFLVSETNKTLHYEVSSNPSGLCVTPTDGALAPGETAEFKVKLSRNTLDTRFKVLVYVENDVFESEVKVLPVRVSRKNFLE